LSAVADAREDLGSLFLDGLELVGVKP
jgi:hypothetical protein